MSVDGGIHRWSAYALQKVSVPGEGKPRRCFDLSDFAVENCSVFEWCGAASLCVTLWSHIVDLEMYHGRIKPEKKGLADAPTISMRALLGKRVLSGMGRHTGCSSTAVHWLEAGPHLSPVPSAPGCKCAVRLVADFKNEAQATSARASSVTLTRLYSTWPSGDMDSKVVPD